MADKNEQARERHPQAVSDEDVRQVRELCRQAIWDEEMRQLNEQYQEQVQAALEVVDRSQARAEQVQESVHSLQDRQTNFRAAATLMQMRQESPACETTPCPCVDCQNIFRLRTNATQIRQGESSQRGESQLSARQQLYMVSLGARGEEREGSRSQGSEATMSNGQDGRSDGF